MALTKKLIGYGLTTLAAALVVAGVALLSVPAAMIVAGCGLLAALFTPDGRRR